MTVPTWLSSTPPSWAVLPIGAVYDVQLGKMLSPEAASAQVRDRYLRNANVQWDRLELSDLASMGFSESDRRKFTLRTGDLLVCEGGELGRAALVPEDFPDDVYYQKALHRVRRRDPRQQPRWLFYCLRAAAALRLFQAEANESTIGHLTAEKLRAFRVPVPPVTEQAAICAHLDDSVAELDRLVAERKAHRSLLQERRQATVYAEVTGRSGHEDAAGVWTARDGRSPTVKLTHVARLGSGHTPSRSRPDWWTDCSIPWITTGEVQQVRDDRREVITDTRERISEAGLANSAAELHPKGTVVLCRTAASAGYSAVMGGDMATSQDFATWTCGPKLDPFYLLFCLRAMRPFLLGYLAQGSTHRTIYMPDIEALRIPLPPLEEQRAIVVRIREHVSLIDELVDAVDLQLRLLDERRQTLITAAVTGAIDLAGEAA